MPIIYIKLILSVASYALPCIGFIVFLINSSRRIHRLEDKLEAHGGSDINKKGTLYSLGTLSYAIKQAKNERKKLWTETCLVTSGAICGIIALFFPDM